ncbi:MAG: lipid II flippase MurJ [Streptosporangiaceae bacterium]
MEPPSVQTSDRDLKPLTQRPAVSIGGGATLIAGLTLLSRMLGLVRTLVFSQTVGAGCLGTAYVTAYQVPNLISELVVGGALTSAMVPILARSAALAGDDPTERAHVARTTSALLTWMVVALVPVSLLLYAVAEPIATLLNPANSNAKCVHASLVANTGGFLEAFAPQILLYGISVVLFGLLQAYRRFTAPALAPIVASLVLITTYLIFRPLGQTSILSVGTTLSIAVLVVVAIPPIARLRLRLRPTFWLPPDLARFAGGMAVIGLIEFAASDLASVVVIALANGRGDTGAIVIFNYAFLVFNAFYGVLALSITTSVFPVLSARVGAEFDRTCAGSTRAVMLAAWLGTGVMAAMAIPVAHVLAKQPHQVTELTQAFILFAPGVAGYAIVTNLSRALFARRHLVAAGAALGGSWLLVMAADAILAELAPAHLVVPALALGGTIGQTLAGVGTLIATRRICGKETVRGIGRATVAGVIGGVAGAAGGIGLTTAVHVSGQLENAAVAVGASVYALLAFAVLAYAIDRPDLKVITRRVLARLRG